MVFIVTLINAVLGNLSISTSADWHQSMSNVDDDVALAGDAAAAAAAAAEEAEEAEEDETAGLCF